ncbi:GNAT family N-acetyltransferase [Corynebacterium pseudopelargi]|uniref:Acetyltransferase (GNAT) family protein n=1 Tax=Corynebacterium pseudopelargi TaxID=2080757 RepID=A0A3G6IVH6_9CORY|nr:GNAT family N-acetyltransferase [Corynebacterium pseudopelargi]AZA09593.1 Acetyltransferase (GNAT) family protein [Corynebacterium pseudopelargi]
MQITALRIPHATLLPWEALAKHPDIEQISEELLRSCLDAQTQRFTTIPAEYTLAMAKAFLRTPALRWAIMHEGRYSGNVELRKEAPGRYSMGYNLAPWARGKGLMRMAAREVADYALHHGAHTIEISTMKDNAASKAVAQAIGARLVHEGDMWEYELTQEMLGA